MKRLGVRFHDLTRIFEAEKGRIYIDSCCHYNQRGNDMLAAEIANLVAASIEGAEASLPNSGGWSSIQHLDRPTLHSVTKTDPGSAHAPRVVWIRRPRDSLVFAVALLLRMLVVDIPLDARRGKVRVHRTALALGEVPYRDSFNQHPPAVFGGESG